MRTANPVLGDNTFGRLQRDATSGRAMTLDGTVNKTFILLLLVVAGATWTWQQTLIGGGQAQAWMLAGLFGGLIAALVTIFKPTWAPVSAPIYAVLEGLFLGGVSAFANRLYPGIVPQAVALTFGTLFCLLVAYRSGLIRATENFKRGVIAATGAIFFVYVISMVLRLFGITFPFIHEGGIIGIGFSLFVVVIAALNLVLDFDFIEQGVLRGAPKSMEWYGGFGLVVTLVWLYLEMLRLLMKLRDND